MKLDIASPCRGICKIDESSQLCGGCLRSIDEITRWSRLDDDQKLSVLSACLDRQSILGQAPSDSPAEVSSTSLSREQPAGKAQ